MPVTVTIAQPPNTAPPTRIDLPFLCSGTASPSTGHILAGVGYQINTGIINPITPQASWSFTLRANDCPTIGATYLLTVYAGDDSGQFASTSVSFVRNS